MKSFLNILAKKSLPTLPAARCALNLLSTFILALMLMPCLATAQACVGPEFERTMQIYQLLQADGKILGYQCVMSGANMYNCIIQGTLAITQKYAPVINTLSPSCQLLLNGTGGGGGRGETFCNGGVCCDNSGCY